MFAFLKRTFLLVLGFTLIAVFVWYAGPLFAFNDYRPLESATARLIVIAVVVACWLASRLLRRIRAFRASDRLLAAVIKPPAKEEVRASPEALKLRERFEEAVATLQKDRRDGHSLYELPWYVIIGAPGSGKTTALLNSGLKFPLEPRVGRGALRGVGGTRNCDWWFTDEAVFLDTAGRYTTQDSDAESDSAGWAEFLALLRKYRSRRPINGVILTISAHDLMVEGESAREAHIDAARRRLHELNRELRIQLPVYLMVTKCDLVAGFTEYFDDFTQDARAQVWGVTFPYEQTLDGQAAKALPAEIDNLMARLNARLFARIEDDRDVRRRARVFAFPQQMAALRDLLVQFVDEVFEPSRTEPASLLRGVYFTSGTQEGTPIDRLLGSIGRRFGVAPDAVAPPTGRGKAYFVERLLKEVMIGESGLAGVNRRVELRKAAAQLGAYAAMVLVAVLGIVLLSVSYGRNHAYITDVTAEVARLHEVPAVPPGASQEMVVARLNGVRAVYDSANRYRTGTPWMMHWGLYQANSIGNAARDGYVRELDGLLLPRFAARIRQRVLGYASDPDNLYEYLKAYLMLGEPQHVNPKQLQELAEVEWKTAGTAALSTHFKTLLELSQPLRPSAVDAKLVAQARNSIRQASVPRIMYARMKRSYATDPRVVRLNIIAGVGVEDVLARKSGVSLSQPVPALYGRPVFKEASERILAQLVTDLAADSWVWGGALTLGDPRKLAADVLDIYEREYITAWDGVLDDLEIKPSPTVRQTADALAILSGPTSPLRGMLAVIVDNTSLVQSPNTGPPAGALAAAAGAVTDKIDDIFKKAKDATGLSTRQPGSLVAAHFEPIHRLMAGAPGQAPIDNILAQLAQVQQQLKSMNPDLGGTDPAAALSGPALRGLLQSLKENAATLAPAVGALVSQIGHRAESSVLSGANDNLRRLYQLRVLEPCLKTIAGRYPFDPSSPDDILLVDFAQVFGPGGLFDTFYKENNLAQYIDDRGPSWTWRSGGEVMSRETLARFEAAQNVRSMFFRSGSSPQLDFSVILTDVDASATRFVLQIDRHISDSLSGARKWPVRWPSSNPGKAQATFEDIAGPWPPVRYDGPWAWFRLIDEGRPQRESDQRVALAFQNANHRARVIVEADSIRNPFTNREWRRFSCGS